MRFFYPRNHYVPKKKASSHHKKKHKTELRGGNVTLRQLLVAAQKMACAIRVQEQNPGQEGNLSSDDASWCYIIGELQVTWEFSVVWNKNFLFWKKGWRGREGKKNEIETVFNVFWDLGTVYRGISQLAAQGFLTYFESEKKLEVPTFRPHTTSNMFSFPIYVEPKPEIAQKKSPSKTKMVWLLSTAGCDQYWIWCVTMMRVLPWSCLQMTASKT